MSYPRATVGALVAGALAATLAASLVGIPLASAAPAADARVVRSEPSVSFSPNGDRHQDKARIAFTVSKKSKVNLKVRRTTGARKIVLRTTIGTVKRGTHTWRWNGKNKNRRILPDGDYRVVFIAHQLGRHGKTRRDATAAHVDTVYEPPGLTSNSSSVYPLTSGTPDVIGFRHGNLGRSAEEEEQASRVELRIYDAGDTLVHTRAEPQVHGVDYPFTWDGRDDDGRVLPAGRYRAVLDAVDLAGNAGTAGWAFIEVSGVPLVEATGTITLPPVGSFSATSSSAAARADGRSTKDGGDDVIPVPCGSVVPSSVYADAGSMSYRSSDACGGTYARPSIATADGAVDLGSVNAPRGISTVKVAMRGRPTVSGEADAADLAVGLYGPDRTRPVTSPAVDGESVTANTLTLPAWVATRERLPARAAWSITTHGVDSYDVAAVTVTYTYLTPQQ